MVDRAQRRSVLAGLALPSKPGAFDLHDAGWSVRLIFRGSVAAAEVAGTAFGVALPVTPCVAASAGERHALWLGPDEWMLVGPEPDGPALISGLTNSLGSEPHSLVDVGHRSAALILEGAQAADILNAGCPLDLGLAVFPVGACVRTLFGKAEIVLWRTAPDTFRLEAARSFLPYVAAFIAETARGYVASD